MSHPPPKTFSAFFGVKPSSVIASMDKAGDDVPNQRPHYPAAIDHVGVERQDVPVKLRDPLGLEKSRVINCEIFLSCELAAERRGIHMSRLSHIVAESLAATYDDLADFALKTAQLVQQKQSGAAAFVKVSGRLSYVLTPATSGDRPQKKSLEHIDLFASARTGRGLPELMSGVGVNHITACPCVQQTLKHTNFLRHHGRGKSYEYPLMTHSQRCHSTVKIRGPKITVPVAALLKALDQAVILTRNTLPRDEELLLVYRAHTNPQFLEDAVREMLAETQAACAAHSQTGEIEIGARSMESIHSYDLVIKTKAPIAPPLSRPKAVSPRKPRKKL